MRKNESANGKVKMSEDRPSRDPMLWHIAFWFALSIGLLTAFVVRNGRDVAPGVMDFLATLRGNMIGF
jgi:hypothetical protein